MTTVFHQFKLRIPSDLMERVEAEASFAGRSLSAEIVFQLTKAYGESGSTHPSEDRPEQKVMDQVRKVEAASEVLRAATDQLAENIASVERLKATLEERIAALPVPSELKGK